MTHLPHDLERAGERAPLAFSPVADLAAGRPDYDVVDGKVVLNGSRGAAGEVYFPARELSMRGGFEKTEPVTIGPKGTLYSYSTVHVSSRREVPYTIGYVDFPDGARVLSEIRGDVATLGCDRPVELKEEAGDWYVVLSQDKGATA